MSTNVTIDPDAVNLPQRWKRKGVALEVALSPYDVPEQVTGAYCKDKQKFVIRFLYPAGSTEATRPRVISEHLVAQEGQESGRLYFLEVDVHRLKVDEVQLKLEMKQFLTEGIKAFESTNQSPRSADRSSLLSEMNARVLGQLRDRHLEHFFAPASREAAQDLVPVDENEEIEDEDSSSGCASASIHFWR